MRTTITAAAPRAKGPVVVTIRGEKPPADPQGLLLIVEMTASQARRLGADLDRAAWLAEGVPAAIFDHPLPPEREVRRRLPALEPIEKPAAVTLYQDGAP